MTTMPELPDYEDLMTEADVIRQLMIRKAKLDIDIKNGQTEVYRKAMTDTKFFENGKPPSVSYVKSMFEYSGIEGELIPLRKEYAEVTAELEYHQTKLDAMKTQIDIYRTESANNRKALL